MWQYEGSYSHVVAKRQRQVEIVTVSLPVTLCAPTHLGFLGGISTHLNLGPLAVLLWLSGNEHDWYP